MKKSFKILIIIIIVLVSIFILDYVRINVRYFIQQKNQSKSYDVHGNKDGLVPQGLAYSEKYDVILQTAYSSSVSRLYVIDFKTGELVKDLKLINKDNTSNTKHVGGIATYESIVWISNDYEIDIYNLDDVLSKENSIKPTEEIKIPNRGDFCYFYDNILWVGDFYLKPFYDVPNGDPKLY